MIALLSSAWRQALNGAPLNEPFRLSNTDFPIDSVASMPQVAATWQPYGPVGRVYVSDGPETLHDAQVPEGHAVLDDNPLPAGTHRVVLDHQNGLTATAPKALVMAFENQGTESLHLTFQRVGMDRSPGGVFQQFVDPTKTHTVEIAPGQRHYTTFTDSFTPGQIALGMLEIRTDQPLRVQTALVDRGTTEFVPGWYPGGSFPGVARLPAVVAPVPPHIRGVFAQSDTQSQPVTIDVSQGTVQRITLDGPGTVWPTGNDATPGRDHSHGWPPQNAGNYGVWRTFRCHLKADPGSAYDGAVVMLMPGGGTAWAVENEPQASRPDVVELRRNGDQLLDVLPIYNGPAGVDITYPYMCVPEASAPIHLVVVPATGYSAASARTA